MTDNNTDFLLELDDLTVLESELRPTTNSANKGDFLVNKNIYVEANKDLDRAKYQPLVITAPPTSRNKTVNFKGEPFTNTPVYLGTLFEKVFIVATLAFPSNSLYTGTNNLIFPPGEKTHVVEGVTLPAGKPYTINVPLIKALGDDYYPKSFDILEPDEIGKLIRKTKSPQLKLSVVIPVLSSVVTSVERDEETGDELPRYETKVALFRENVNLIQANALLDKKLIDKKSLPSVIKYLFGGIVDLKDGDPIILFDNREIPKGMGNLGSSLCAVPYSGKIAKSEEIYFPSRPDSVPTLEELERIIYLEMIISGVRKGDTMSPLGITSNYFWEKIREQKERNKSK